MTDKEKIINSINCYEHFNNNKQKYIELFVSYYGEENRSKIEEQFSNAMFIAYQTPKGLEYSLNRLEDIKTKELVEEIVKDNNINLTSKDIMNDNSFEYESLHPIKLYIEVYELYSIGKDGRKKKSYEKLYEYLKQYVPNITYEFIEKIGNNNEILYNMNLPSWIEETIKRSTFQDQIEKKYQDKIKDAMPILTKIDPSVTIDNIEEKFKNDKFIEMNTIVEKYYQKRKEYYEFKDKFKDKYETVNYNKKLEEKLGDSIYKAYVKDNIDLLPKEKQNELEKYLSDNENISEIPLYIKNILGFSINSNCIIDSFSQESEEILNNEKKPDWIKSTIIEDRIKYFKSLGIDLGDNYQNYVEKKEIWPSKKRIEKFVMVKNRLVNEFNNTYYSNIIPHKTIRAEIDKKGLVDNDDSYNATMYIRKTTCVNPNIIEENDEYKLFSLVLINCDLAVSENIDHYINHELNHLYELSLINASSDKYNISCGWDIIEEQISEKNNYIDTVNIDKTTRKYELFNEIINETIAQEITEKMQSQKIEVFSNQTDQYKGQTSYEHTNYLIRDFYKEYKEDIIKSRSDHNINIILDKVGKENFEQLNDLFLIHNNNFQEFKIYSLIEDLSNKKDTENTKLYYELIEKRDKILENMRKHSMLYDKKNHQTENDKAYK